MNVMKKDLAAKLRVSRSRLSQLVEQGLPVNEDGSVPYQAALIWVVENLSAKHAPETVENARKLLHGFGFTMGAASVLQEVPAAVVLAAAEMGLQLDRAGLERLANLALAFLGGEVEEQFAQAAEFCVAPLLPHPAAWPDGINWPNVAPA